MKQLKHQASRRASGDWEYRGFIISQDYRTKRWVAFADSLSASPVFWTQTLRSSKVRIDDHISFCEEYANAND
jgi:hypothetical protein